jgi:hypothetical protein
VTATLAPRQISLHTIDEIKRRALFVFIGFASEYSLAPLHRRMDREGFDCVEIDGAAQDAVVALRVARETGRKRVLLTSQHPYFGKNARRVLAEPPLLSGLEVHALLQPEFAVFAPHDLLDPLHPDEAPFLRAFDLYLAASEDERCLWPYCKVEVVGWLKFSAHELPLAGLELRNQAIWFVAHAAYEAPMMGIDKWADLVAKVADGKCSIKLAEWPNAPELEAALHARGQHTIPASTPFIQVARSADWIICDGASSVIPECQMLGRKIHLIPVQGLGDKQEIPRAWTITQEPNCCIVRALDEVFLSEPNARLVPDWNPPHALDAAIDAVLRHLGPAMART